MMQRDPMDQSIIQEQPRQVIGSYATYAEAQAAVDYLSDREFPVERTAIVAEGLRLVEQVTGRKTWGSRILSDALTGALIGAFVGFFFGLFSIVEPVESALTLAFWGIIVGAIIGAIVGLLAHWFSGGRRDFSSVTGLDAERYVVMVDVELANQARGMLTEFQRPQPAA